MRRKTDKVLNIQVGQEFLITIKKLGINGEGIGYYKHQVVFVPGVLPTEEVVVRVAKVHEKFCEAEAIRIKKHSAERCKPTCSVYGKCGGCQLQHMKYPAQLEAKRELVIQALLRHSDFTPETVEVRNCIGMDDPKQYRNKSQFQIGTNDAGELLAGLYSEGSHRLIDIHRCGVQHPLINQVTNVIKGILQTHSVPIYDEKRKSGIVRTIVTRVSFATGEVQVTFVTISDKFPGKYKVIEDIRERLPEVVSIFQNVNKETTPLVFGQKTILLWGRETITERLGELTFELSARTFFQLNPIQTIRLYDEVKQAAALTGKERVVDAYCGVGTIGLWLADEAAEIRGVDIIPESIADAKENAKRNGKKNLQYEVGKAEKVLPLWKKKDWTPDVVIVDPPRTGLDQQLVRALLDTRPKKIVYVSCNPSTFAKDLHALSKVYKPKYIQPIDLFSQTAHVECCSLLERKK